MTPALRMAPAIDHTAGFVALIAPGEPVTFQTFGEGAAKAKRLGRILHGTLAQHQETLAALNAQGAAVCMMVNAGKGGKRNSASVQRVRAVFVDLDGSPLEPVTRGPLAPHCIVESSPGHWHAYWRVSDCLPAEFKPLQKALAARFHADASVCDLARVMRLPGFDHRKGEPFRVRIVHAREAAPFSVAELRAAFGFDKVAEPKRERRRLPDRIPEGERNATLLSLAGGLVRKGYAAAAVTDRLQQINAGKCEPPLCESEVDAIAARAIGYGSEGFTILPHALLDSPDWKSLTPPAQIVILTAFRRYDGGNNGNIALTWADFAGLPGFGKKHTLYRHRAAAVASGILRVSRDGTNSQTGRAPDLFAIASQWIKQASPVPKREPGASAQKVHPYIDKQRRGALRGMTFPKSTENAA